MGGGYTLTVAVAGRQIIRRLRVAPGQVTWKEFRP
jgi:hypothetical protein